MWYFTSATVSTIAQLFKAEKRKQISGVVGSYEGVRQAGADRPRRARSTCWR